MEKRIITIFSTKGKQKAKIESDVMIWGELKPLIEAEEYDLDNLQAIDSINHAILAHPEAKLPEGKFVVFLKAVKTKSGADYSNASYGEMKKALSENDKAALLKEHGKNFTKCTTENYRKQLMGDDYTAPAPKAAKSKFKKKSKTTSKEEKVEEVVAEEEIIVPEKKDNETKAEKKVRKAAKKARKEQKKRLASEAVEEVESDEDRIAREADEAETTVLSKEHSETFSKVK